MSSSNDIGPVTFHMLNADTPTIPRKPVSTGTVIFTKATSLAPLTVKIEGSLKSRKFITQVAPFSLKMELNYPSFDGSLIIENITEHMAITKKSVDRNQELKFKWMALKFRIKIARDSTLQNPSCDSSTKNTFFWTNLGDLKPTDVFFQLGRIIE